MTIIPINPYQKISKRQMFQLFWYSKMVVNFKNINFDYLTDFHVTESLIQQFNHTTTVVYQNKDIVERLLCQYGLYDVEPADVRNVMDALWVRYLDMYTTTGVFYNYSEEDVRNFVASYIAWINYFYYQYDTDYRFQAKPVIWDTHRSYNAYIIMQLERGALMEMFVDNEFRRCGIDIGFYYDPVNQSKGENRACIEIKHDMASERTGNYYIEFGETLFQQEIVSSGILKNDNVIFWLIGTPNDYQIIYKKDLQQLFFSMNQNDMGWQDGKRFVSNNSSRGFIVKKEKLKEIAVAHSIAEFVKKFYVVQAAA